MGHLPASLFPDAGLELRAHLWLLIALREDRCRAILDRLLVQRGSPVDVNLERRRPDGQWVGVENNNICIITSSHVANPVVQSQRLGGHAGDRLKGEVFREMERVRRRRLESELLVEL